jgi:hypothetical protein
MRQWLRRRRYRRAVKIDFGWLLSGFPNGFSEVLWQRHPGIEADLPRHMALGEGSEMAALQIVSSVITHIIEQSDDLEWKHTVLDQLKCAKDQAPTDSFASGILRMESTAYHWALANKFDMTFRDIMMSEIIGALAGKSANERRGKRLSNYIFRGLGLQ